MRRIVVLLIIMISALLCTNINASTLYKNVPEFANNYLKRFNSYSRYFVTTDAPYGYEIDEIKNDSNYKLGGLLNRDEFLNSMDSNGNTYLFNGLEYWTMTKSDSSKMMVIDPKSTSKISNFPYDRSSGIRNTEYVQNGTYLNGSGTYTDPWTFVKKHYVTFVYDDTKIAINPRVAFAPYNGAITVRVTDGNAYVYSSNDCGAELTIENKLKLENIKKDITCNISTALAYHTITYNPEGYCTPNTKTIKHGKEIGEMCAPIKTGYTFTGWYDEETGGTKVTKKTKLMEDMDLYARFEANTFIVEYVGNGSTGGSTASHTCTYDEECNLKTNGFTRTGYTFSEWNTNSSGTGTSYAVGDSIKNIVTSGTKQFYAIWKANPITLAASTSTVSYSTSAQTKNNFVTEATGGTGSYKYEIVSGNDSSYFTLSGRDLTIKASTPAGTYSITIKATDNNSGSTAEGIMTLVVNKIAAKLTCSNKTYNGSEQTACSCSGGTVGGTYKATYYSSTAYTASCTPDGNHTAPSNKTWTMSKKSITITAKAQTINYGTSISNSTSDVTVATLGSGDSLTAITLTPSTSNYTTSGTITPSAATIKKGSTDVTSNYSISYATGTLKINKVAATLTCSNKTYNGTEQTACSCSGGTVGGEYKATNYRSTAYSASCTPDGNHTAPSNKTWTMSKAASSITCKSAQNYTGSAITSYSASNGCTPGTNASVTAAGTYTVSCTGDSNHNNSSCSFTVNKASATNSVTITGTNTSGQTLTASVTTNSDGKKTYQWWYSTNSTATSGTDISGATGSTYTIADTYVGKYIGVTVNIAAGTNWNAASTATDITDATNNTTATVAQSKATVKFDCNGGNGTKPSNANESIGEYTVPTNNLNCGTKIVAGATGGIYYQTGWSSEKDGNAVTSVTLTADGLTLYAKWTPIISYNKSYKVYNDGSGNWRMELKATGTLTVNKEITVDIFAVGGGGGGGGQYCNGWQYQYEWVGSGGGGGGYTNTVTNKKLSVTTYAATIGAGGAGGHGNSYKSDISIDGGKGKDGGKTSFGNLIEAAGGAGGEAGNGGDTNSGKKGGVGGSGGSGGGAGKAQGYDPKTCDDDWEGLIKTRNNGNIADGGTNGTAGGKGGCMECHNYNKSGYLPSGGTGCEKNGGCKKDGNECTNTSEFCTDGATKYAGGGGGGVGARNNACGTKAGTGSNGGGAGGYPCYNTGNDGTANTGGGGGGAASCKGKNTSGYSETGAFYDGGTGGSGVIIIRNKR